MRARGADAKRGASDTQCRAPCGAYDLGELRSRCVPNSLVQIQMLSTVNRVARWNRLSPFARSLRAKPCRERYDDNRQRKNQREPKSEAVWLPCHLSPSWQRPKSLCRTLGGGTGGTYEPLHTRDKRRHPLGLAQSSLATQFRPATGNCPQPVFVSVLALTAG